MVPAFPELAIGSRSENVRLYKGSDLAVELPIEAPLGVTPEDPVAAALEGSGRVSLRGATSVGGASRTTLACAGLEEAPQQADDEHRQEEDRQHGEGRSEQGVNQDGW